MNFQIELIYIYIALAGIVFGILISYLFLRQSYLNKIISLQTQKLELEEEQTVSRNDLINAQNEIKNLNLQLGRLESESKYRQDLINQKEIELVKSESLLKERFENYANQILDSKTTSLREVSKLSITSLLDPLKEKINDFQTKVEDTYGKESREIFSLKEQIEKIAQENKRLSDEASNLTRALKGDTQKQGRWGELVLERILETAGLKEGSEYILQGKNLHLKSDEGEERKPDVVILLPDGKKIIIDSKTSLVPYERYVSSENDGERENAIKEFMSSFKRHIKDLSSKSYQTLDGLDSPDFVLMFCPSEGAFALALGQDPDLLISSFKQNIVPVSPTNLLAVLKTVSSLWRLDKQGKNVKKIAEESGNLYDKFVDFLNDLTKVGDLAKRLTDAHNNAVNKLKNGRGNLISRVEKLKSLGAANDKNIPEEYKVDLLEEPTDNN